LSFFTMGNRSAWLRNPKVLLALTATLLAFVVQSGELGSADTVHRLQTAHSFWTTEPAVFPNEYPEFGVHGRGGKLYDWYGIGQPLLLLPSDIIGTYLEKLPIFRDYNGSDPTVRNIFVTYATNTLLSVLTAMVCFRFLLLLVLYSEKSRTREFWNRSRSYAATAFPVYAFFLMIDRVYQFYRFGSWTDTYVHYFSVEHRLQDPTLSAKYPWETPFHIGFLGPLISPEKSIFLFDPLIVLSILLA